MPVRIGINGFERMVRLALQEAWRFDSTIPQSFRTLNRVQSNSAIEILDINEINGDIETVAHLKKFDRKHGKLPIRTEATLKRAEIWEAPA